MKPLRRRHPHPEIPLVSTADVAFLLLIFFLATAIFSAERGLLLSLPTPGEAAPAAAGPTAHVAVAADRSVRLDGRPIPTRALRAELSARMRREPGLLVRITLDPVTPYAALIETLDQVKLSGARRISLQAEGGA